MITYDPIQQKGLENELLDLLEDPDPKNYDRACNLFAELAVIYMDELVKHVDKRTSNLSFDSESHVSDVIFEELEKLTERFWDPNKKQSYMFCKQYEISLKSYLMNRIGYSNFGKNSGKIKSEIKTVVRRNKIMEKYLPTIAEYYSGSSYARDPSESHQLERMANMIREAIKSLLPQEQFIIRVYYHFDIDLPFTSANIKRIAASCGYQNLDAVKIKTRFQRSCSGCSPVNCLGQKDVSSILDFNSSRQLRRTLKTAIWKIKEWLKTNYPDEFAQI